MVSITYMYGPIFKASFCIFHYRCYKIMQQDYFFDLADTFVSKA